MNENINIFNFIIKLCISVMLLNTLSFATITKPKYIFDLIPKQMSTKTKKKRFFYILVPAIDKVHGELMKEYKKVEYDLHNGTNKEKLQQLKIQYGVKTNKELLACLKPHPKSITLAQAAMESAWATSRFFIQANNCFGMWSSNKNEPRIAAGKKRDGKRTIWLKKFDSVEDSIRAYYRLMAKGKAFKEFRALRLVSDDPHKLVEKLDKYSEIGPKYGEELSKLIKHNKLAEYD